MKKLISMTDFVLEQKKIWSGNEFEFEELGKDCVNYANFLKTPLKLEMFIACDDEGNVLEEPEFYYKQENLKHLNGMELLIAEETNKRVSEYKKAKEKVLFEGFDLQTANFWLYAQETIEDLIYYDLQLTKNAIKKLVI
jgi:hypothetical protein